MTVVVITGGAGGMGRALGASWVADGAAVHLVDRDERVFTAAADVGAMGHLMDLTDPESAAALTSIAPAVDVLVTAAGVWPLAPLDDLDPATFRTLVTINLDTVYVAVHALRDALRSTRGAVVAISSAVGMKGHPQMLAYAAAKAGVIGLVKSLALALGPDGVRVNAIAPGLVLTPEQLELWGDDRARGFRATRALDTEIDHADIVAAVRHFASPAARAVTGQTLVVDGGTVLH